MCPFAAQNSGKGLSVQLGQGVVLDVFAGKGQVVDKANEFARKKSAFPAFGQLFAYGPFDAGNIFVDGI